MSMLTAMSIASATHLGTDISTASDGPNAPSTLTCSSLMVTINIDQPVSCSGGSDGAATASGTGGTAPYTYLWDASAGAVPSASVTGLPAGIYNVTITDANGCTATESVMITEPFSSLQGIVTIDNMISCSGASDGAATASGIGGTSPYTYQWTTGETTQSITGLSAGIYNVTITDANECSTTEHVLISDPSFLVASTSVLNNTSCGISDGMATVSGSGGTSPYTYLWSNGATTATMSDVPAGEYTVTITDANGCTASDMVTIAQAIGSVPLTTDTLYVDAQVTMPGDGSSWTTAFADLQEAIDSSNTLGGGIAIWVAEGTYRPTRLFDADDNATLEEREKTFLITHPVSIIGGFTAGATSMADRDDITDKTILTGDLDNGIDTAYHVINMSANNFTCDWYLDGLTIRDGAATGAEFGNRLGAGINAFSLTLNSTGSPQIANCTFYNNRATTGGASILLDATTIEAVLINCTFYDNYADRGGAIYYTGSTLSPQMVNCVFYDNSARFGGAIFTTSSASTPIISPKITNCTFTNNTASGPGSSLHNLSVVDATIKIHNSIIWDDTPFSTRATGTAISSIVKGGFTGGTNVLDTDPLFVDAQNGDLRLSPASPAINAGMNSLVPQEITNDRDGVARIRFVTVDMGAYEGTPCSTTTAGRLYVDAHVTTPGDGSCWATAFADLQQAIDVSNTMGGGLEIWVAEGTYRPTHVYDADGNGTNEVRERTFYITHPVIIRGGFTAGDTSIADRGALIDKTILTGDLDTPEQDTAYHVLTMHADSIDTSWQLYGLTIRDGRATGNNPGHRSGGGIYVTTPTSRSVSKATAFPVFFNCAIYNNSATEMGGAISVIASSNSGPNHIAQAAALAFGCLIYDNSAESGGGISILADAFSCGNLEATATTDASAFLLNNTFYNNTATSQGGALNISSFAFTETHTNASTQSAIQLGNSIFKDNSAANSQSGPDLYVDSTDNNQMMITNNILQANGIRGFAPYDTMANLYIDPLLVDPTNGNMQLQSGSPAINGGANSFLAMAGDLTDIAGNPRIYNGIVDIGALESRCTNTALTFSPLTSFLTKELTIDTDNTITADNVIASDEKIKYHGALGILLDPDFEVKVGALFEAAPIGCSQPE